MNEVDKQAKIIWEYMLMHHQLHRCDIIMVLGGYNTTPAKRAAELFLDGYGEHLLFSGGLGKVTKESFKKTEAETFADIAIDMGVPKDKIFLETKATNTGENITFTYNFLESKGQLPQSILTVVKPYFERRAFATFKKQWADRDTEVLVSSPQVSYEEYFAHDSKEEKDRILDVMVGDFQRICEYPKRGLQIEQEVPEEAQRAYRELVQKGYTRYLITSS